MADAGANLPSDERILIRRVVADEENGFRFVKLIHREQGIFRIFAESREQAGVIGGRCGQCYVPITPACSRLSAKMRKIPCSRWISFTNRKPFPHRQRPDESKSFRRLANSRRHPPSWLETFHHQFARHQAEAQSHKFRQSCRGPGSRRGPVARHGRGPNRGSSIRSTERSEIDTLRRIDVAIVFGAEITGSAISSVITLGSSLPGKTLYMTLGDYSNSAVPQTWAFFPTASQASLISMIRARANHSKDFGMAKSRKSRHDCAANGRSRAKRRSKRSTSWRKSSRAFRHAWFRPAAKPTSLSSTKCS